MDCPACSAALKTVMAGEIELDVCQDGCGGIWFDRNELIKFDEPHEFDTHPLLNLAKEKEGVQIDHSQVKNCPKCPKERLVRQFFDAERQVEIDQCWSCCGIWLDCGELNQIRAQYETYEERAEAVNSYVDEQITETKGLLQQKTRAELEQYEQDTRTHFHGGLYALKKLLGI